MKFRGLISILIMSLMFACVSAAGITPVASRGILDLRNIENREKFVYQLNGEWEFYWGKMLNPTDFVNPYKYKPDCYGKVPSYWTDYSSAMVETTGMGFATYKLTVLLPKGFNRALGFDMPVFDSSYDIYINNQYMTGNGVPGRVESETRPWYEKVFFKYVPSSDTLSIIINVANFHHRRGGFWMPVKMGTFPEVQTHLAASWARDWAAISLLLGFSLFFLFFFIIYPKDRLIGFFSMATIGLALRPLFTSNFLIQNIVPMGWVWTIRLEYIGLYLILTGWYWFTKNLYPTKYFRIITLVITVIFSVAFILTLFLPVKIFSYMTLIIYPLLMVLIFYTLFQNIKGILRRNFIDYIYFAAFIILSAATIHDVRVSMGRAGGSTGYILTYALVLFVFIQAILLLYKWVKAYSDKERLQNELEYMNKNLEILVNERTHETEKRKEEIEKQNVQIAYQNRQLSETIQLKNRIFSLIAHDLRSPVVNILYMLNLLKEEEYKEKYNSFANSSIQYAQQVISLLENMLVWGRGQEDKIKFSPERRDLADIVLTNMSIFKETADKKDISINFTQIGNSKASFDKDLLDIIIRNLLSNAIKYTPRGGRISILLKDKNLSGEGMVLKVCDNGIGIPRIKQKYLFTSAEIESTPGTEDEKGTGFGLKLCHELINLHKGKIIVESRQDEGTCFTIILPSTPS
jgi:signal transduction histidine kinase